MSQPQGSISQQRDFVRLKGKWPVLVYAGKEGWPILSYAVDLSGGGFLIAGPDVLEVGEQVEFQLTLVPESPPIKGVGTVVRSDVRGHRGILFSEVSGVDRRRVVRFIFECERNERRRALEARECDGG